MKFKTISWILVITILILGTSWYVKTYKMAPLLPAYEQELIDPEGLPVNVSAFKGRYVVISYFQTWCADCIREIPSLEKLLEESGKDKLTVILVSDESKEKLQRFKEKHAGSLPVYT